MTRTKASVLFVPLGALLLSGCTGWQSVLDPHGLSATHLQQLILFIVAVCAVVWALVLAVLLLALFRKRGAPQPQLTRDPATERRMTIVVAGSVAATVIVIAMLTIVSFFTTRSLTLAAEADLTIQVRGKQWWWELAYLDPSPNRTFFAANEIHIPVGRAVRIQLEGVDVIHSFWVPSLAGKQDMIPGRLNELTIRAERPGVYRGQCAEFCGLQHAHMALFIIAEPPETFEAWQAAQRETAVKPADAEIQHGERVFAEKACAGCHTVRGTSAAGKTGPDLTHVGSRQYLAAGLLETTRGSLAAWIADPQTLKPGNNMPLVPLTPEELQAVSAYMASLK